MCVCARLRVRCNHTDPYSIETGGWSNKIRIFPGDYQEEVGTNDHWHSVRIEATADGEVRYSLDDVVKYTVTDPSLQSGKVQFIPGCVGMTVRNVVVTTADAPAGGGGGYQELGAGYCADWAYLPEGGYPPRLDMGSPMYNADPVAECMNRCLNAVGAMDSSSFRAIRDRAFYVNAAGACGCSAGGCETQRGADEENPYRSFRITVAGGGGPPGGGGGH